MEENKALDDLEILERLKNKIYKAIDKTETSPKVGDLLKVIEMKSKLSVTGKAEKKFWEMINKIREEKLSDKTKSRRRKRKPSK
ncbi:MAG: hypothetical protein JSU69_09895 [Candidatus Zixiibacteriota bacterium]|nr:MAG: hypothetical protein JSU69_09895 [candidate division Zixibacteria bacterium]